MAYINAELRGGPVAPAVAFANRSGASKCSEESEVFRIFTRRTLEASAQ
jgi:hypothetical protein